MTMNVKTKVLQKRKELILLNWGLFWGWRYIDIHCWCSKTPHQNSFHRWSDAPPSWCDDPQELKLAYDTIATYSGTRCLGREVSYASNKTKYLGYRGMCGVCAIDSHRSTLLHHKIGLFFCWGKMSSPLEWCLKTSSLMHCHWTGVCWVRLKVWSVDIFEIHIGFVKIWSMPTRNCGKLYGKVRFKTIGFWDASLFWIYSISHSPWFSSALLWPIPMCVSDFWWIVCIQFSFHLWDI